MNRECVIVVAGGGADLAPARLPPGASIVAADEGLDSAFASGLRADIAVGDFDSASPAALARARAAGTRIVRHPRDKDMTDLELALDEAAALEPRRIVVFGATGGRLDHLLGGLLLLGAEQYAAFEIDAVLGPAIVHIVRRERTFEGQAGELVSLFPLHGAAEGVHTEGLAYPLRGDMLPAGSSRGTSNVLLGTTGRVVVRRGVVAVLRPGAEWMNA